MELAFSDEQILLADTVRRVCDDAFTLRDLRAVEGTEPGFPEPFWRALVELGFAGAAVPQSAGGAGLGALDVVAIYEQFGRALVSSPHHVSSVLAADLIGSTAPHALTHTWLEGIAEGRAVITVASIEPGGDFSRDGVRLRAEREGDTWLLTGEKHFVPFAGSADAIIVLARTAPDNVIGLVVDSGAPGIERSSQRTLAAEPHALLRFERVAVPAARVLHGGADIWDHWQRVMFGGIIPLAAQAVGAATRVHEITVAYAKQRHAFGRAIGGFQAIAHYLADAIVAIEGCRTLVHQAAWARDRGLPFHALAAMAKLKAGAMFRQTASLAIQVHGGLGYTTAADPQLFFRRAKQWQLLNWNESYLEEQIADLCLGNVEPVDV